MNKNIFVSILISGILVAGAITSSRAAQTAGPVTPEISYPVAELGNCADKSACKAYCDESANTEACLSFAGKNNLMSPEEVTAAKNFKNAGLTGPGGCKGKNECKTYCGNSEHMDECVTFAEKNGLMSGQQLAEAKKVQSAIAKGLKPPACGGKETCDAYCSSSEHMEECVNFSIEAGIMDPQKQDEAKKVLDALKRGIKPPACNGKAECDTYCVSAAHREECAKFGEAIGMVRKEGAGMTGKTEGQQGQGGPGGGGPGGQGGPGGNGGGGQGSKGLGGGPGGSGQGGRGGGGGNGGGGGQGQGGQGGQGGSGGGR